MGLFPQVVFKMSLNNEKNLKVFHALDHPTRLEILSYVFDNNPSVSYSSIKTRFSLSDGNLSHHLKVLLEANLIDNVWQKPEDRESDYSFYSTTKLTRDVVQQYSE